MVVAVERTGSSPHRAIFLVLFLFLFAPFVSMAAIAADTDGDGVEDHLDDCPLASGSSTTDRDGCPDRDGDGMSDWNDRWSISGTAFLNDQSLGTSFDYWSVDHSPSGDFIVSGDENGYVRIWNTTTHQTHFRLN